MPVNKVPNRTPKLLPCSVRLENISHILLKEDKVNVCDFPDLSISGVCSSENTDLDDDEFEIETSYLHGQHAHETQDDFAVETLGLKLISAFSLAGEDGSVMECTEDMCSDAINYSKTSLCVSPNR